MESLSDILSSAAAPDKSETPVEAPAEPAKDEKPAAAPQEPAASAPSAEQAKSEEKPEAAEKPAEPDPEDSQTRDEKGRFTKPEELESMRKAMLAERKKRQEAERRAEEAARKAEEAAKPKEEAKPKKDFWEDPEAALNARDERLQREIDSRIFLISEKYAKRAHEDYDEVLTELEEDCKGDPALTTAALAYSRSNPDEPAEAMYQFAVNRRALKTVGGDLGKFKESIAEPFKASVAEKDKAIAGLNQQLSDQAKQIKSLQSQLDKLGKVPSSLNTEPSASRATVDAESAENDSLEAITESRKKRRA